MQEAARETSLAQPQRFRRRRAQLDHKVEVPMWCTIHLQVRGHVDGYERVQGHTEQLLGMVIRVYASSIFFARRETATGEGESKRTRIYGDTHRDSLISFQRCSYLRVVCVCAVVNVALVYVTTASTDPQ
jgi:hypothetical protein